MKHLPAIAILVLVSPVFALDGDPRMHDPSTIVLVDGKFYSYGTGNGLPISVSDDGWTWRRAGTLMQALAGGRPGPEVISRGGNNTWAPDVIRSGHNYFVYFKQGTYEIESARTGTALELAVQGMPVGGLRGRGGRGCRGGGEPVPAEVIPAQEAGHVSANWPSGPIDLRMSPYMVQAQQKWTITPVANAGGYPGSPYFKITVAGTDRALAATEDRELVALPAFTGGPEQLWRIDQLTDGTYRVMPKAVPNSKEPLALSAAGSSMPTLDRFSADSERQRWLFKTP